MKGWAGRAEGPPSQIRPLQATVGRGGVVTSPPGRQVTWGSMSRARAGLRLWRAWLWVAWAWRA